MEKVKQANAHLQEAARLMHSSALAKEPFVQKALKLIAESQISLMSFRTTEPRK